MKMTGRLPLGFSVASLLFLCVHFLPAQTGLDSLSLKLAGVETLQADFVQERHLALFEEPLISKGRLFFQAPERLRWQVNDPFQSVLIYNSGRIAKFDVIAGRLRRLNSGGAEIMQTILRQITAWMHGDFKSAEGIYDIKRTAKPGITITLVPRSDQLRQGIRSIQLKFNRSADSMREVRIQEAGQDYMLIRFSNELKNTSLDARLFDLAKPLMKSPGPEIPAEK